jgi:hypothetical protein
MTREEWLEIHAYIASGSGKSLNVDAMRVYFDLLGDLPFAAMRTAAQRVLIEHPWSTFPSIAELREAATATLRGAVADLSPGEAWSLAWRAIGRIDPEQEGSIERGLDGLPRLVTEAVTAMGIPALCFGKEPVGVLRGQFMKIFEQLSAREKRQSLLPPQVMQAISRNGKTLREMTARIGVMPE